MSGGQKKKDFYNRGRRASPCSPPAHMDPGMGNDYYFPTGAGPSISPRFEYDTVQSPPPLEALPPYSMPASPPPLCPISEFDSTIETQLSYPEYPSPSAGGSLSFPPYPVATADPDYGACGGYRPQGDLYDDQAFENYDSYNTLSSPGSDPQFLESDLSEPSAGTSQQGASSTRRQKCSLCFNHGIVSEKKGHKWKCPYRECNCESCTITKGRQKTMKEQQKLTRDLIKMRLQHPK